MNCKNCYVEGCTHRPFPNETECVFRQWIAKYFDWQSFRAEAAKDFTIAILSNPRWSEHFKATDKDFRFDEAYYKKVVIGNALSYTDELIKQLKEKDEKL